MIGPAGSKDHVKKDKKVHIMHTYAVYVITMNACPYLRAQCFLCLEVGDMTRVSPGIFPRHG